MQPRESRKQTTQKCKQQCQQNSNLITQMWWKCDFLHIYARTLPFSLAIQLLLCVKIQTNRQTNDQTNKSTQKRSKIILHASKTIKKDHWRTITLHFEMKSKTLFMWTKKSNKVNETAVRNDYYQMTTYLTRCTNASVLLTISKFMHTQPRNNAHKFTQTQMNYKKQIEHTRIMK